MSRVLVSVFVVGLAESALATVYLDESAWRSAVSNSFLLDTFEGYSQGTGFGHNSSLNLTFEPLDNGSLSTVLSTGTVGGQSHTGPNVLLNSPSFPGQGTMRITPDPTPQPLHAMGLWNVGGDDLVTLSFFRANGSLIESVDAPTGQANNVSFIGLVSTEAVAHVTISAFAGNGWFSVDDMQVSYLPTPSTLGLLIAGAVVSTRRRR